MGYSVDKNNQRVPAAIFLRESDAEALGSCLVEWRQDLVKTLAILEKDEERAPRIRDKVAEYLDLDLMDEYRLLHCRLVIGALLLAERLIDYAYAKGEVEKIDRRMSEELILRAYAMVKTESDILKKKRQPKKRIGKT